MKILVIAAHPDDEVLGCGGTIAKLSKENNIYTLILGEGVTSRNISDKQKLKEQKELKENSIEANRILGVKNTFFESFSDNRFDSFSLLEIIKPIEKIVQQIKPDIVFTHHNGDLNIDHRIVYNATLTALRPIEDHITKKIYSFEVLSSTEWNEQHQSLVFCPNVYSDVESTIDKKIDAMKCYKNEICDYPHPRSIEGIEILAKKRGLEIGLKYAEAFHLIRDQI